MLEILMGNKMNRTEAIKFLHKQIKEADSKKLQNLICSCFAPLCSADCPLKNKISTECKTVECSESAEIIEK